MLLVVIGAAATPARAYDLSVTICMTCGVVYDCDSGSCTDCDGICSCSASCFFNSVTVDCYCWDFGGPGGSPGSTPFERHNNIAWKFGSDSAISLENFGGLIENVWDWGVELEDYSGLTVTQPSAPIYGTFQSVIEGIANNEGWGVSWDTTNHIITLDGDP